MIWDVAALLLAGFGHAGQPLKKPGLRERKLLFARLICYLVAFWVFFFKVDFSDTQVDQPGTEKVFSNSMMIK